MTDEQVAKKIEIMFHQAKNKSLGAVVGVSMIMHSNGNFEIKHEANTPANLYFCLKIMEHHMMRNLEKCLMPLEQT